jgi:hypothetical protein
LQRTAIFEMVARRKSYERGTRVKLVEWADSALIDVPPGTSGTVTLVDDAGTVFVNWDNGRTIGATVADKIEVLA